MADEYGCCVLEIFRNKGCVYDLFSHVFRYDMGLPINVYTVKYFFMHGIKYTACRIIHISVQITVTITLGTDIINILNVSNSVIHAFMHNSRMLARFTGHLKL